MFPGAIDDFAPSDERPLGVADHLDPPRCAGTSDTIASRRSRCLGRLSRCYEGTAVSARAWLGITAASTCWPGFWNEPALTHNGDPPGVTWAAGTRR